MESLRYVWRILMFIFCINARNILHNLGAVSIYYLSQRAILHISVLYIVKNLTRDGEHNTFHILSYCWPGIKSTFLWLSFVIFIEKIVIPNPFGRNIFLILIYPFYVFKKNYGICKIIIYFICCNLTNKLSYYYFAFYSFCSR